MTQAECVPSSEDILSGAVKWPSHDGPTGIVMNDMNLNEVANKETVKRSKIKVWTKLSNGLFAYRVRKTVKKSRSVPEPPEQEASLGQAYKWVPKVNKFTNIASQSNEGNSIKRKLISCEELERGDKGRKRKCGD